MNQKELKDFARKHIENDGINIEKIGQIILSEDGSNRNVTEYLGDVDYIEDGEIVSSVFSIVINSDGKKKFIWS